MLAFRLSSPSHCNPIQAHKIFTICFSCKIAYICLVHSVRLSMLSVVSLLRSRFTERKRVSLQGKQGETGHRSSPLTTFIWQLFHLFFCQRRKTQQISRTDMCVEWHFLSVFFCLLIFLLLTNIYMAHHVRMHIDEEEWHKSGKKVFSNAFVLKGPFFCSFFFLSLALFLCARAFFFPFHLSLQVLCTHCVTPFFCPFLFMWLGLQALFMVFYSVLIRNFSF